MTTFFPAAIKPWSRSPQRVTDELDVEAGVSYYIEYTWFRPNESELATLTAFVERHQNGTVSDWTDPGANALFPTARLSGLQTDGFFYTVCVFPIEGPEAGGVQ